MNPGSWKDLTDDEVLANYRASGDDAWFAELVRRHRPAIERKCRRVMGNRGEAEDMAQETFLRAFRKLDQYGGGSFGAWLGVIARSVCLNRLAMQTPPSVAPEGAPEPAVEAGFPEEMEDRERALAMLALLSVPQSLCVKLFYLEGWSLKQIAVRTGMEERAVRSHLQNGRRRMRAALEQGVPRQEGTARSRAGN